MDTEHDDRHPTILELDDGTLMCTFFSSRFVRVAYARYMLSHDGGQTWTNPMDVPGKPQGTSFGNGSAIALRDGTVVWVMSGRFDAARPYNCIGVLRSNDRARSFELAATIGTDHTLEKPTIAEVADGQLTMAMRREGDVCFSPDGGRTWRESATTG